MGKVKLHKGPEILEALKENIKTISKDLNEFMESDDDDCIIAAGKNVDLDDGRYMLVQILVTGGDTTLETLEALAAVAGDDAVKGVAYEDSVTMTVPGPDETQ